jgi:hypothetical protein
MLLLLKVILDAVIDVIEILTPVLTAYLLFRTFQMQKTISNQNLIIQKHLFYPLIEIEQVSITRDANPKSNTFTATLVLINNGKTPSTNTSISQVIFSDRQLEAPIENFDSSQRGIQHSDFYAPIPKNGMKLNFHKTFIPESEGMVYFLYLYTFENRLAISDEKIRTTDSLVFKLDISRLENLGSGESTNLEYTEIDAEKKVRDFFSRLQEHLKRGNE